MFNKKKIEELEQENKLFQKTIKSLDGEILSLNVKLDEFRRSCAPSLRVIGEFICKAESDGLNRNLLKFTCHPEMLNELLCYSSDNFSGDKLTTIFGLPIKVDKKCFGWYIKEVKK